MERSKHRNKDNYVNEESSKKSYRSASPESDEWVEKEALSKDREDWMSMTGMLKTYTKEDIKPKREEKDKKHIDSYNPATSSRELNPYWKHGGSGVPQTAEAIRESRPFMKPKDDDDYYSSHSSTSKEFQKPKEDNDFTSKTSKHREFRKTKDDDEYYSKSNRYNECRKPRDVDDYYSSKSSKSSKKPSDDDDYYNSSRNYKSIKYERKDQPATPSKAGWRKGSQIESQRYDQKYGQQPRSIYESDDKDIEDKMQSNKIDDDYKQTEKPAKPPKGNNGKYLSDEKMNKLGAKIVKAEIMGDTKLVNELKIKLEEAREYRKQNPNAGKVEEEDNQVMLMSTNSVGNTRPLTKTSQGDAKSKGGKRKAETHDGGQRAKYFGDDDKYNLAQMFQQEKYGTNYDNDEELAKVASKSKNPNDDLEDIFTDEISKNRNAAKDDLKERERAIKQHVKMERSLEGCEYCLDSKNMLKHLMVSCGSRAYVAVPARKSLVEGHCLITTIQHATCVTSLDEDVWEEIMDYRKALTKFFNSQDQDVVFFETASRLNKYPHMVINCVPLPRDVGDMAAIYFKKALLECEAEWAMNRKVIELKGKNVRKGVPKGLPYFWVDFGMDPGFAHIIEDQQLFPKAFAEEIIGGMLDLDHSLWKNPKKEYGDLQRKKVLDFVEIWRGFDTVAKK